MPPCFGSLYGNLWYHESCSSGGQALKSIPDQGPLGPKSYVYVWCLQYRDLPSTSGEVGNQGLVCYVLENQAIVCFRSLLDNHDKQFQRGLLMPGVLDNTSLISNNNFLSHNITKAFMIKLQVFAFVSVLVLVFLLCFFVPHSHCKSG